MDFAQALSQLPRLRVVKDWIEIDRKSGKTQEYLRDQFLAELHVKLLLFGIAPDVRKSAEQLPVWASE